MNRQEIKIHGNGSILGTSFFGFHSLWSRHLLSVARLPRFAPPGRDPPSSIFGLRRWKNPSFLFAFALSLFSTIRHVISGGIICFKILKAALPQPNSGNRHPKDALNLVCESDPKEGHLQAEAPPPKERCLPEKQQTVNQRLIGYPFDLLTF